MFLGKYHAQEKFLVLFLLLAAAISSPIAIAQEDWTWLDNGKPVSNADFKQAKGQFCVWPFLSKDPDILRSWEKDGISKLVVTHTAKRNVPLLALLLFRNPGEDKDGADITGQFILKAPDGSVISRQPIVVWRGKLKKEYQEAEMTHGYSSIVIEDNDPAGQYEVDFLVQDNIRKIAVSAQTHFTVDKSDGK